MENLTENQFGQLQILIKGDIERIINSGNHIKRKAMVIRVSLISMTFLVTVILGIGIADVGEKIALVISALISAVTTWESYAQYQRKLVIYTQFQVLIEQLIIDITLYLTSTPNWEQDRFDEFKNRYTRILEKFLTSNVEVVSSSLSKQTEA